MSDRGSEEFSGKAAIVTGAAKGIGRSTAMAFAARGVQVALVDLDQSAGEQAASEIEESGGKAIFIQADVGKAEESRRAVEEAVSHLGRIDFLVNSAGIQRYGDVVETDEEVWDEVIASNLKSVYAMAKHCVPQMKRAGGGAIVNVASVQALAAQRGVAAYSASKGGVVALTKAMAVDHAPQIRVNAVCPGSVDTPMLRDAAALFAEDPEEALKSWGEMHPMGRIAKPEEVAEVIIFLAGPRSSFVTGSYVLVDGGLLSVISGT